MQIRPFESKELEAVAQLSLNAWAPVFRSMAEHLDGDVYRAFYPEGWQLAQRRAVEHVCADPNASVWVAEEAETIAGFVAVFLHLDDRLGEIHMIAVDPSFQGRGVGRRLTDFALDRMREAEMNLAMVETGGDPGHGPARKLYERAGFGLWPVARYFKKL